MDQLDLPTPKRALPKYLSLEESRSLLSLTIDGTDPSAQPLYFYFVFKLWDAIIRVSRN